MIASTPSTRPRVCTVVDSVTHALKAASFAPEPKKLITQSRAMIAATARATADAVVPPGLTMPKLAVVIPHSTYPTAMNGRRVRALSDAAPTSMVASVAAMADAATVTAMIVGSVVIVL